MFAGGLVQRFPWIRDRMIFDDKYLFKVLAECVIDCGELAFLPWHTQVALACLEPSQFAGGNRLHRVLWVCLRVCAGMAHRWHLPLGMLYMRLACVV